MCVQYWSVLTMFEDFGLFLLSCWDLGNPHLRVLLLSSSGNPSDTPQLPAAAAPPAVPRVLCCKIGGVPKIMGTFFGGGPCNQDFVFGVRTGAPLRAIKGTGLRWA